jgi:alkylation response protein AidB-like acyl-CoA dehydrogenase
MTIDYDGMDEAAFRQMLRDFIEAECPAGLRHISRRMRREEVLPWTRKLAAKGWICPAWPTEHGGMGLSTAKVLAFQEEFDKAGVPRAPDMGVVMLGPLLMRFGTEEQRQRFLPPIARAEMVWCQGYSEPNAGSDLASLRCEAEDMGDHYLVNGQKTWTTLAQDADWIFMLVRTDKTAKKQEGISFLLTDITTPGITRRPIKTLSGEEEFCEVFFDNVRVPKENLVGKVNQGWTMAKALLGFERLFLGSPKQSQTALQRLNVVARGTNAFVDPAFLDRYGQLSLDAIHLAALYTRFADQVKRGEALGPDVSILKLFGTATYQRITELAMETAGERGVTEGGATFGNDSVDPLLLFYSSRPATIYGGSNEIQRNILAKAVLNLPDA